MTWVTLGVSVGSAVLGGSQAKKAKKEQDAAARDEEYYQNARQNKIGLVQGQVDAAYNNPARQQQYNTFASALRGFYGQALDKKKVEASNALKFGLAKQGQIGSSVAVTRQRKLGEELSDAANQNERSVQSALAGLKSSDEASRVSLRDQAANGLQLNQAEQRANAAQGQALGTADVTARAKGVGDVFSDTLSTYKAIQDRKALAGGYTAGRQNLWGMTGP